MSKKIALLLLTVSVIMTSVLAVSLPHANALTQRDFSIRDDTPTTASHGISKVCGNHLCAAGEHAQWINILWQSQRAGKIVTTPSGQDAMNHMTTNTTMNHMTTNTTMNHMGTNTMNNMTTNTTMNHMGTNTMNNMTTNAMNGTK